MREMKANVSSFIVLMVVVTLISVWGQAFAADQSKKISPVLDRILTKKELVVGTAASMPPFNMTTKDGQIVGLEIDLANLIADAMNVKLTLKTIRFNDLLSALESGQIDMILSSMTITPGRNLKVVFVGPYFVSGKSILTKQANIDSMNEVSKINNPDKTLVALKGSTSQIFAEKIFFKAKLMLVEDYDRAVAVLREDKVQAMVADMPICQLTAYRYPDAGLTSLKNPLSWEPLGIAIPPNDLLLLNWLQNFLNTIEKDGSLATMGDRWFKDNSWISRLP
jgi:polar amino acid transport system substrate-binding protein